VGPSASVPGEYNLYFDPVVSDTTDDKVILSFDVLSFSGADDPSSWVILDEVEVFDMTQ
jgi:hypothetical protein